MKLFGFLRCLLLSHVPNRRKVRRSTHDHYIGHCLHCGAPIKRLQRDKWARDWGRTFGIGNKQSEQSDEHHAED